MSCENLDLEVLASLTKVELQDYVIEHRNKFHALPVQSGIKPEEISQHRSRCIELARFYEDKHGTACYPDYNRRMRALQQTQVLQKV